MKSTPALGCFIPDIKVVRESEAPDGLNSEPIMNAPLIEGAASIPSVEASREY